MALRPPSLPLPVLLLGVTGLLMSVPSAHALTRGDFATARVFGYGAVATLVLTLLIWLATRDRRPANLVRSQLVTLFAAFAALPAVMAVPFAEAVRATTFLNAWFEMLSCFTTTGATLWDNPFRLNPSVHVWRAMVAWFGGFVMWTAAVAILAPLNLGGFEVQARRAAGDWLPGPPGETAPDATSRVLRHARRLLPVYGGLTLILWIGLILAGEGATVAFVHAVGTISTSGITSIGGLYLGQAGVAGEAVVLVFLVFGLSRATFPLREPAAPATRQGPVWQDPELRLGLSIAAGVTALLFLRHFVAVAGGASEGEGIRPALGALWGALFTTLSFLTTTGYESVHWIGATDWSGLTTPGLILVGIALIGGGVATTAGGVKLLRVHALLMHGQREAERLIHPSSLGGAGQEARRMRREGAYVAWIFFMLYALAIVAAMLMLSLTGVQFETAMVLAVAAITNTGPLAQVAAENAISFAGIPDEAKLILAATMVLGRLETLALIALFNPEFWRS